MPADLQQVGQERLEPLQLALQQLRGAPDGRVVEGVAVLVEHVRGDADGGQGRAQLVRDVRDELALHLRQVLQLADLLLEVRGHVVEGAGEARQIVLTADPHALFETSGGEPLRALGGQPHGDDDLPRDQRGDGRQEQHQDDAHSGQGAADVGQGLLFLREGNR